jgi:hypothetical protein
MNDDPQEISKHLIAQHGAPDAVLAAAVVGAVEAQKKKDLYRLSAYSVMLSGYCGIWLRAKRSSFFGIGEWDIAKYAPNRPTILLRTSYRVTSILWVNILVVANIHKNY